MSVQPSNKPDQAGGAAHLPMCFNPDHNSVCERRAHVALFARDPQMEGEITRLMKRAYVLGSTLSKEAFVAKPGSDATEQPSAWDFLQAHSSPVELQVLASLDETVRNSILPGEPIKPSGLDEFHPGDIIEILSQSGVVVQRLVVSSIDKDQNIFVTEIGRNDLRRFPESMLREIYADRDNSYIKLYRPTLHSIIEWGKALDISGSDHVFSQREAKEIVIDPLHKLINSGQQLGSNFAEAILFIRQAVESGAHGAAQSSYQTVLSGLLETLMKRSEVASLASVAAELPVSISKTLEDLESSCMPDGFVQPSYTDEVGVALWKKLKTGVLESILHAIDMEHKRLDSSLLVMNLKTDSINPQSVRLLTLLNFGLTLAIRKRFEALPAEINERREISGIKEEINVALERLERDLAHAIPATAEHAGLPGLSATDIAALKKARFPEIPEIKTLNDLAAYRALIAGSRLGDARQAVRQKEQFGLDGSPNGGAEFLCGYGNMDDAIALLETAALEMEAYKKEPGFSAFKAGTTALSFFEILVLHVEDLSRKAPWLR